MRRIPNVDIRYRGFDCPDKFVVGYGLDHAERYRNLPAILAVADRSELGEEGEAFGERNPEMVQWVARSLLDEMGTPGEQYEVGEVVQFSTPDGLGQYAGSVQRVGKDAGGNANADAVQFDFNHPLAGQPVTFEVQVIGVL